MKFLKKLGVYGCLLVIGCAAPKVAMAPRDLEVSHIIQLIQQESPERLHLDVAPIAESIVTLSHQYAIDPMLVLAIIKIESRFNPMARSHVGAMGLMQVMPIVAREVGSDMEIHGKSDLYDPTINLHLGIRYFSLLRDQYELDIRKALVAYNMGPTALNHRLSRSGFHPTPYCKKVMGQYIAYLTKKRGLFKVS